MAKKLIITEEQYSRLFNNLNEFVTNNTQQPNNNIGLTGNNNTQNVQPNNNVGLTGNNNTQNVQPNNPVDPNIDSPDEDRDVSVIAKYYKEIMDNPILRKAFYKAPNFWEYFVAALKGKPARGSGIGPALRNIDNYLSKEIDGNFPGFKGKEGKAAKFILPHTVTIAYKSPNGTKRNLELYAGVNGALVQHYEYGDSQKILKNGDIGFKVVVKKNIQNEPDIFICDIFVEKRGIQRDIFYVTDVKIKFIQSNGYSVHNNEKNNK